MSGFKGTPGPWSIATGDGMGCKVAELGYGLGVFGSDFMIACHLQDNARLIAAAPELLEALVLLTEKVKYSAKIHPELDNAYDAIAKALGTESDQ